MLSNRAIKQGNSLNKAVKLTVGAGGAFAKKRLDVTCNFVWRELGLICAPVPGLFIVLLVQREKNEINCTKMYFF